MSSVSETNLAHSATAANGRRNGTSASRDLGDTELAEVRDSLRGLRYGAVEIIVQDGLIVQINRTEKRRVGRHAH